MSECIWCGESFKPGDKRAPTPWPNGNPIHWECGLRSIVGGLNHLNGRCLCCGGDLPPDPEGCTRREAAKMAAQAWIARNPPQGANHE